MSSADSSANRCKTCGSSFRLERGVPESTLDQIRLMGRFQLFERVGMGSFGAVWRGLDTHLNRVVALKIPHAHSLGDPEALARIDREIRSAAQLRHPGIVRLYEVVTIHDLPVLVSDFIEGATLKELLKRQRLSCFEAAYLTAEIAEALDYAHTCGLVHRDIKPGNIMMEDLSSSRDRYTSPPLPKPSSRFSQVRPIIVDFGLALRSEAEVVMTIEGQILGTPAYMSPEQAAGHSHYVDARSDVYSLGVVFYELLCGEIPFRGSKSSVLHQVLYEEPKPPRRINNKISRDAETICLKAMAKRPEGRYQSCAEFAADLRRLLAGEPILARPVGRWGRLARWCLRNPGLAAALAAAVTATLALLIVSLGLNIQQARALHASRRTAAMLALARGSEECEQANISQGLLWFARALEESPADEEALVDTLRAQLAAWYPWHGSVRAYLPTSSPVGALAYSADGNTILTCGEDNVARFWDARTCQTLGVPVPHTEAVNAVALSTDGKRAATSTRTNSVFIWDATSGMRWGSALSFGKTVSSLAFSPNGRVLAVGCIDRNIYLYDLMALERTPKTLQNSDKVRKVDFARNGKTIYALVGEKTVCCWDVEKAQPVHRTFSHGLGVRDFATSACGDEILIATSDRIVHLWKPETGQTLQKFPHQRPLQAIAFAPDGETILTSCLDGTLRIWNAASGRVSGTATRCLSASGKVVFSPDGRHVLGVEGGPGAWLCQLPMGVRRVRFQAPAEPVSHMAFSLDGNAMLVATGRLLAKETTLLACNSKTGERLGPPISHPGMIVSAAISPDGALVATGGIDRQARIFDIRRAKNLHTLEHKDAVFALAFSRDGSLLLTGSQGGAYLWDTRTGRKQAVFPHDQAVLSVAFHPDGNVILTGTMDQGARLWRLSSSEPERAFSRDDRLGMAIFDPTGNVILTAGRNKAAHLWDARTGESLGDAMNHQKEILAADFGLGGRFVVTGSADATACVWDGKTGRLIGAPLSHSDEVDAVAFHPSRFLVLTGCADQTARLWDPRLGKQIGPTLVHDGKVSRVAFHPHGGFLTTGSNQGMAMLWGLPDPLIGEPRRIRLWLEVQTAMQLNEQNVCTFLDGNAWLQRRNELKQLGGAPLAE